MIGNQEDGKGGFMKQGNCIDCYSTRTITEDYRFVSGDVYVLRKKKLNKLQKQVLKGERTPLRAIHKQKPIK